MKITAKIIKMLTACIAVTALMLTYSSVFASADSDAYDRENFHRCGAWGYTLLDDGTVAISQYYGTSTKPKVPSVIDGFTVTAISGGWYSDNGETVLYGNVHSLTYSADGNVDSSSVYSPFSENTKIKTVTIPETVKYIGAIAFKGCTSLTTVTFGENVQVIGNNAFEGCTALTEAALPESVKFIDEQAFKDCSSLSAISLYDPEFEKGVFLNCTAINDFTLPIGMKSLPPYMFSGCTSLKNIVLPGTISEIGDSAFSGCTSLGSVTLPDSVTIIYNNAFKGCTSLEKAELSEKLDTLGSCAFADCGLKTLYVPESLVHIGDNAFGMNSDGKVVEDFTLSCPQYAAAQSYAEQNGINVNYSDRSEKIVSESSNLNSVSDTDVPEIFKDSELRFKVIMGILGAAAVAIIISLILIIHNARTGNVDEADEYDFDDDEDDDEEEYYEYDEEEEKDEEIDGDREN